ncbi:tetratricopeptide repeat protein [Solidesulfovibrio alcoholivorans]|uniref:tetratricopeptide repeat protein n=1 Tax=Solidesulfovibrio alcoholivorans TaxID=81406 RepID=UPI0005C21593|nr:tetratricopeptide repeat protein [Solidesulfovibrio alcoholivorans]
MRHTITTSGSGALPLLLVLPLALALWLAAPAAPGWSADPAQAAVRAPDAAPRRDDGPAVRDGETSGFRVELRQSAPAGGAVRVGGAASFEAHIFDGNRELGPDGYVCRWKGDDGARFLEREGPFTNTAVFLQPGHQRVWVEVVPRAGPSKGLAAVSEPVDLDVGKPAFALSVQPASPLVGEEVTVSIRDFPVHDGVEFRWDPLPDTARLVRVDERALTFYPTAAGNVPVRVTATARPESGREADLGAAAMKVAARPYAVTVENKGLLEAPATVWREGEGPVPADGVAVGQNVRLRAAVSPPPRHAPLSYGWSLCPGARVRGGEDGREIAVSRESLGACKATLEVRDSRGLLLGKGEGGFEVTVSREALDTAVAKARETDRLVAAAGQAWAEGDPDRALTLAAKAARGNPKNIPALAALERIDRDKTRLDSCLAKAGAALAADDFSEVAAMLGEAAKVNARAGAIEGLRREAAARRDVLDKVDKLLALSRERWDAGAVDEAIAKTGEALRLDPGHAAARAARERLVADRERLLAALKQSSAYLAAKRFDSAALALDEARAVNPRFAATRELETAIAARKDKAWRMDERLARARDQWNAGEADASLATLTEALALDPEHSGASRARGEIAQARERLVHAEDKAEAAIAAGKPDEARSALAEAATISPRHARLASLQSALAHRLDRDRRLAALAAEADKRTAAGDLDGAILAVNDMLALTPGNPALTARRDKLTRARDAVTEALARARDYLGAKRFDLALDAVAEAEAVRPGHAAVAGWREKVVGARKQAEAAVLAGLDAVEALLRKKDVSGADAAYRALREKGPLPGALAARARDAERRIEAGLAGRDAARRELAGRDARPDATATAERKARCEAIGRQAVARRAGGDHAGAIRDYQDLLKLCPDTCQAYNNVGASLFSLGYAAESLPWFDEAVKCAPGEKLYRDNVALTRKRLAQAGGVAGARASCAAAFDAAEAKRGSGDLPGAIEVYKQVVAGCPDFCAAYNNMGLSLHKLGRTAESLPLFEQALRCNPQENLFKDNYELTAKRLRTADRGK